MEWANVRFCEAPCSRALKTTNFQDTREEANSAYLAWTVCACRVSGFLVVTLGRTSLTGHAFFVPKRLQTGTEATLQRFRSCSCVQKTTNFSRHTGNRANGTHPSGEFHLTCAAGILRYSGMEVKTGFFHFPFFENIGASCHRNSRTQSAFFPCFPVAEGWISAWKEIFPHFQGPSTRKSIPIGLNVR